MGERNDKDDRFSDGPPRGDRRSVAALRALTGAGVRVLRPVVRVTGIGEVTERILLDGIDAVLRSSLIEEAVDRALARGVADQVAARIFEGPELERIATAALESPGVNRVADRVVNGPSVERLVAEVIESRLMDETVARLLESEDLWILVDEIARSPSVTDAIGHQGLGFAEQLAAVVRERSRRGDARLEHVARRWARRDGGDSGSES